MANNCWYEMKVAGRPEAVEEFYKMISWKDEFKEKGFGRVYSVETGQGDIEYDPSGSGNITKYAAGDCA